MLSRTAALLVLACVLVPLRGRVQAASTITGIVVYSADFRGMPTGFDPQSATIEAGQLWHTFSSSRWFGLGVLRGLPPESFTTPLLNAGDFGIRIPLESGDHDFTLVGEPGPLTEDDGYDSWALNIFLDGVVDRPAISVLFPRGAYRYGVAPRPNGAEVTVALPVVPVSGVPQDSYDDGRTRITVSAVSFLPPHRFVDVDLVSSAAPVPSADGQSDWVGVLRVSVETTAPVAAGRGGSRAIGPEAFGVVAMDGVAVGGDGALDSDSTSAMRERASGWRAAPLKTPTPETTETGSADEGTPTPESDLTPERTATSGTATPGTPTRPSGSLTPPPDTPTPAIRAPEPTGSVTALPGDGATPSPPPTAAAAPRLPTSEATGGV